MNELSPDDDARATPPSAPPRSSLSGPVPSLGGAGDVARYLPLSQRPRRDESGVSGDWAPAIADALDELARSLEAVSDNALDASQRPGWTVAEVVADALWRLGTPRTARARELAGSVIRHRERPPAARLRLARLRANYDGEPMITGVRELAGHWRSGTARGSVADLSAAVIAVYDIAGGSPVTLDPVSTGAVALARSLNAPLPIRAVLADRCLVAVDADWRVGTGRQIEAPAAQILAFLFGRAGLPTG